MSTKQDANIHTHTQQHLAVVKKKAIYLCSQIIKLPQQAQCGQVKDWQARQENKKTMSERKIRKANKSVASVY